MFNPSSFAEGGGLVDNVDATLTFKCVSYDYNGNVAVAVPALHVHGVFDGGEFDEYYSAGDAAKLRPAADGKTFEPVVEGASLNKSSKAAQFITSLFNAGLTDIPDDNICALDGLNAHLDRRADVERKNLQNTSGKKRTILLVTAINSLPGKGKAKGAAKGKPAAASIDAEVDAVVTAAIEAAGGDLTLAKLSQAVFRAGKGNPQLKEITKRAQEKDYLEGEDRPFGFDGSSLVSL